MAGTKRMEALRAALARAKFAAQGGQAQELPDEVVIKTDYGLQTRMPKARKMAYARQNAAIERKISRSKFNKNAWNAENETPEEAARASMFKGFARVKKARRAERHKKLNVAKRFDRLTRL